LKAADGIYASIDVLLSQDFVRVLIIQKPSSGPPPVCWAPSSTGAASPRRAREWNEPAGDFIEPADHSRAQVAGSVKVSPLRTLGPAV
jgi:hypothetical protein